MVATDKHGHVAEPAHHEVKERRVGQPVTAHLYQYQDVWLTEVEVSVESRHTVDVPRDAALPQAIPLAFSRATHQQQVTVLRGNTRAVTQRLCAGSVPEP